MSSGQNNHFDWTGARMPIDFFNREGFVDEFQERKEKFQEDIGVNPRFVAGGEYRTDETGESLVFPKIDVRMSVRPETGEIEDPEQVAQYVRDQSEYEFTAILQPEGENHKNNFGRVTRQLEEAELTNETALQVKEEDKAFSEILFRLEQGGIMGMIELGEEGLFYDASDEVFVPYANTVNGSVVPPDNRAVSRTDYIVDAIGDRYLRF